MGWKSPFTSIGQVGHDVVTGIGQVPASTWGAAAGATLGAYAGYHRSNDPATPLGSRVASSVLGAGVLGVAGAAFAGGGYKSISPGAMVGRFQRFQGRVVNDIAKARQLNPHSFFQTGMRFGGGKYGMLGLAALGAGVGIAFSDNKAEGLAVGAGLGVTAGLVMGATNKWSKWTGLSGKLKKSFMSGPAVIAASALTLLALHSAQDNSAVTSYGVPDDTSLGYDYSSERPELASGVRKRVAMMKTSGDLVFGLNAGRHS